MDRINDYRQIVCQYLQDFSINDGQAQLVFDRERDRYLVMHNEWREDYRIYGCAIQLDIIDGQIWIQNNGTEIHIERDLIALGVSPQDIIFGFRSPSIRELLMARSKQ